MAVDVEITSHVDDVLRELRNAKQRALEAIGLQAEGYAFMLAPHDTGRLRNSIAHVTQTTKSTGKGSPATPEDSKARGSVDEDSVVIGTNVEYAVYQEFGTSRNPEGHPFLKPALMEHLDEYKRIAEDALKNA